MRAGLHPRLRVECPLPPSKSRGEGTAPSPLARGSDPNDLTPPPADGSKRVEASLENAPGKAIGERRSGPVDALTLRCNRETGQRCKMYPVPPRPQLGSAAVDSQVNIGHVCAVLENGNIGLTEGAISIWGREVLQADRRPWKSRCSNIGEVRSWQPGQLRQARRHLPSRTGA